MRAILALVILTVALVGCEKAGMEGSWAAEVEYTGSTNSNSTRLMQTPPDVKYYASDEALNLAREHFARGDYGTAEEYFRLAVEKAPKDVAAWIGLAACYDRIGRFDLADRSYRSAIALSGETVEILNNLGYSYMLRGNLQMARRKFNQALHRDPYNPTIINNLELLQGSDKFIDREAMDDF